jgi:hypothetical protein
VTGVAAVAAAAVAGYWPASASKEAAREEPGAGSWPPRGREGRSSDPNQRVPDRESRGQRLHVRRLHAMLGPNFRISITQADLRLVASLVDTREWTEVNHALSDAANLERDLRLRSNRRHPLASRPPSRHSIQVLCDVVSSFGDAAAAVADLAALDALSVPTFDADEVLERVRRFARAEGPSVPQQVLGVGELPGPLPCGVRRRSTIDPVHDAADPLPAI